ncbi:MAG: hypothetical protein EHM58_09235 [Ignavibacteriae bacterium]|nr:MAG: hypothetical protein EHM58_09235 [Ignavibacteriota bacterium]
MNFLKSFLLFALALLFCFSAVTNTVFSQQKKDGSLYNEENIYEAVKIINEIRDRVITIADSNRWVLIDSILNSHKTIDDFKEEEKKPFGNISDLGNELVQVTHSLNKLHFYVCYVKFRNEIVQITFNQNDNFSSGEELPDSYFSYDEYPVHYWPNKELPGNVIENALKRANFIANFHNGGMVTDLIFMNEVYSFENYYRQILLNSRCHGRFGLQERFVIDLMNPTLKRVYGFECTVNGYAPAGRVEFSYLIYQKNYFIIEKLLYSSIPAVRLYSYDALNFLNRKGFISLDSMKATKLRMDEIKNEKTVIEVFDGCSYSMMSIKDAIERFAESNEKMETYSSAVFKKQN